MPLSVVVLRTRYGNAVRNAWGWGLVNWLRGVREVSLLEVKGARWVIRNKDWNSLDAKGQAALLERLGRLSKRGRPSNKLTKVK